MSKSSNIFFGMKNVTVFVPGKFLNVSRLYWAFPFRKGSLVSLTFAGECTYRVSYSLGTLVYIKKIHRNKHSILL
jgi:hypothetical protein